MPDEQTISKPEDALLRAYIRERYEVRVPQYSLWRLTFQQAAENLQEDFTPLRKITAAELEKAARK